MYKDNIDKTTLINEYNPSNIIISDFIAHPHAIPNSAKNNAPITDSFNILFSSFIILTSIQTLNFFNKLDTIIIYKLTLLIKLYTLIKKGAIVCNFKCE